MKHIYPNRSAWHVFALITLLAASAVCPFTGKGQTCPGSSTTAVSSYPNTYYPATQASVSAGGKSITLGAASYGTTPISSGDILLIIQMQGAQIGTANDNSYGDNVAGGSGSGYLNNGNLMAGNMEYVLATNNVPIGGGTLNIQTGLLNSYKNANYGTDGQYRYQLIRVPVYYRIQLTSTLTVPAWNGNSGGILILYAVDSMEFNGQTIDGSAAGFRGGGGRQLSGASGLSVSDYRTMSTSNANGSKGEGIAGTPRYVNNGGTLLDNGSSLEGYANGSYGRGAPGNAGGGGTDGSPGSNNQNTGGGGGANGGAGGKGGNGWSSGSSNGGDPSSVFAQRSASRLVLGGGGGAGTSNDGTGNPGNGFASSGAAGGGMVIIMANALNGSGTINVNGGNGNTSIQNDGSGGGGAGGSVFVYIATGSLTNLTVTATGGAGGSNEQSGGSNHGPGGGGGGGVIYANGTLNGASSAAAGIAGTTTNTTYNYGAGNGSNGVLTQNMTRTQTPVFPSSCTVLAVDFVSVTANENNGRVTVAWEAAREAGMKEYIVEKSLDGQQYDPVGTVNYKSSAADLNLYNFTDNAGLPTGTVIYYRIQAVEQSGHLLYSRIVSVKISGGAFNGKLSIAPNPVQATATISFTSASAALVSLRLIDMKGDVLWQAQYQASVGLNTLQWQNAGGIPNGIYFLQCLGLTKTEIIKVLVNH